MSFPYRFGVIATAGLCSLALITSCSTGASSDSTSSAVSSSAAATSSSASNATEASFPVTLTSAFGDVTIAQQPERVVALNWINGDISAALGVIPVSQPKMTWGQNDNDSNDWFDKVVRESGDAEPSRWDDTDGIDYAAIAEARPDVIINVIGSMTQEDYDKLSKIAPVVTFDEDGQNWTTAWDDATLKVGKALGKQDKAQEVVDHVHDTMKSVSAKHPELVGATFIAANLQPSSNDAISIYAPSDVRPRLLTGLGMKPAAIHDSLNFPSDAFYVSFSPERANELDSDVFYSWVNTPESKEEILSDPLLSQIPAISRGNYYIDPDKQHALAFGTSPLAIEWLLTESSFVDELVDAINGQQS